MTLFFVLSGFVVHYNYSHSFKENPILGLYNFFVARFARLYPLYSLCLGLDFIENFGFSTLPPTFSQALPYYLSLTQSWFYVPMGTNSLIYQFGPVPQVAWSVSTEWFFYLFYPLICFGIIKLTRVRTKGFILLICCLLMPIVVATLYFTQNDLNDFAIAIFGPIADMAHPQDSFFRWLIYFSPYLRISEFFVGCLTAAIFMQVAKHRPSEREESIGFLVFICTLICWPLIHYYIFHPPDFYPLMWIWHLHQCFGFAPLAAIVIFCSARYRNAITRFLSNQFILLGGEVSYSIYMLHLPIGIAFSRDAADITSWRVGLANCSRLAIALAAILGIAIISYHSIEVPARQLLRKWLIIRNKQPLLEPQSS
jgi:peptidoglycan/LPS O-acetylase OafA/YrhL